MAKSIKRFFKNQARLAGFFRSIPSPGQGHGVDGRFIKEPVKPVAVVVVETRQQRRYKARQATKNPLPLLQEGGQS
jgi:hypothetical protein